MSQLFVRTTAAQSNQNDAAFEHLAELCVVIHLTPAVKAALMHINGLSVGVSQHFVLLSNARLSEEKHANA